MTREEVIYWLDHSNLNKAKFYEAVGYAIEVLKQQELRTLHIDHKLTKEEIKSLKQKIADSPIMIISPAYPEIIRCKKCKYFEYNYIENINGIPFIVAHEICMRWCEGAKTSENGYCFLAERKDNE